MREWTRNSITTCNGLMIQHFTFQILKARDVTEQGKWRWLGYHSYTLRRAWPVLERVYLPRCSPSMRLKACGILSFVAVVVVVLPLLRARLHISSPETIMIVPQRDLREDLRLMKPVVSCDHCKLWDYMCSISTYI